MAIMKHALALALMTGSLILIVIGFVLLNQWEREHNYPFGQMCNSVFTGYVNTCPTKNP